MPERLWAPWRFAYIEKAGEKGKCIFVDLPQEKDDRKNLIVYRGKHAFVMLNAFPYTSGHLMVAPYKHTASMDELSDDELLEIQKLIRASIRWITEAYKPEGFNLGANLGSAAGAGIESHIHWHVVPRWKGDTNFMATVGDVRVLPQSLEDSFDRLRQAAEKIGVELT
jgi:ATP adenylyltransferase